MDNDALKQPGAEELQAGDGLVAKKRFSDKFLAIVAQKDATDGQLREALLEEALRHRDQEGYSLIMDLMSEIEAVHPQFYLGMSLSRGVTVTEPGVLKKLFEEADAAAGRSSRKRDASRPKK